MKTKKIPHKANLKTVKRIYKNIDFEVLSLAIQGVYSTASTIHGVDCFSIAINACEFLKNKGINATPVVGEVNWRVDGQDPAACLVHASNMQSFTTLDKIGTHPIHVWIKLNEVWSLDLTTYQFRLKMEIIDKADGSQTPVSWTPDFLIFKDSDLSTFNQVKNSFSHGVAYYKAGGPNAKSVEDIIKNTSVDPDDMDMITRAYENIKNGNITHISGLLGEFKLNK